MLEISALITERLLEHEGVPVIRMTVATPMVSGGKKRVARRINAFYSHIADAVEKHLRRNMLSCAAADFEEAVAKSRPFEPYRVKMVFETSQAESGETFEVNRRLYTRTRDCAENERVLTETWSTRTGLPEKLKSEVPDYSLLVEGYD